jgi:hypothetical protein
MSVCPACRTAGSFPIGELCESCRIALHAEADAGIRRLEGYLASWAAFDAWLGGGRPAAVSTVAAPPALSVDGFSVLAGTLVRGSVADLRGGGGGVELTASASADGYAAELVVYATLVTAQPRRIGFHVEGDATAGAAVVLRLYDWEHGDWDAWEPGRSTEPYVTAEGEVCLSLRAEHEVAFDLRVGRVRVEQAGRGC